VSHFQIIPRSNGLAFRGDYRTVVAQGDSDFDVSWGNDAPDECPYRHTFELYLSPNDFLVMMVAFFDGDTCCYRHGQRFRKIEKVREFLERYDSCQHLPVAVNSDSRIRSALTKRYDRRRERFLTEANYRLHREFALRTSA